MKKVTLSVIPGDGIGKEVIPEALKVLETIATLHGGLKFEKKIYNWNSEYYLKNGIMMPTDGMNQLENSDAIFLGAIGDPNNVPDYITLWELLLKIRRGFEQTLNIRYATEFKGLKPAITNPEGFNLVVVRENSEGEYSEVGGLIHNQEDEIAVQNNIFTRKPIERAMHYAFGLAETRGKKVTSATKSNGIKHSMPFWDRIFREVSKKHPETKVESIHIDALAANLITQPNNFDVIVASNLFGDILTDISAAIMGSVGIAPSVNLNTTGKYPSMFEPVHGSAPDIFGKGIANPLGQIWTGKILLEHFEEYEMANLLMNAIKSIIKKGVTTPDLGGNNTTKEVSESIISFLKNA